MSARRLAAVLMAATSLAAAVPATAQPLSSFSMTSPTQDALAREAYAYSAAMEAYVFLFPLTMTERERVRRERLTGPVSNEPAAPINQLGHMTKLATAKGDIPYSPNNDTVYTGLGLDLTNGPIILHMPEITDRYASVQVADAYIENLPYLYSSRINGGKAINIGFVGPNWTGKLPKGVVLARMNTNTTSVAIRVAVKDEADLAKVLAYQQQMSVTALADWHGGPSATPPKPPAPKARTAYSGDFSYFRRVADLMADNPPPAKHAAMVSMMRRIGLVPGKPFNPESLDEATRAGVLRAEKDGPFVINNIRRARGVKTATGWTANRGGSDTLDFDYATRAGNALVGLMGNDPEEAIYFNNFFDSNGQPLHGGQAYRLHFTADQLPKTGKQGFWSLTMYDSLRFQFIDNPINRYELGSRHDLKRNADGSVDVLVQPTAPGGDLDRNWLPSPKAGDFKLTIRIYDPTPALVAAYKTSNLLMPVITPAK